MAKRVFFSFHYKDVAEFRANVVRNHWIMKPDRESAGFYDASIWESAKKQGSIALKRLINGSLENTSNTCVLIGTDTWARPWVRYEIMKSVRRDNHIFGVHINSIRGSDKLTKVLGTNPLEHLSVSISSTGLTATTYQWLNGKWEEYLEIDGSASFRCNAAQHLHGKWLQLSELCSTYDWVANDGYNNFSSWVG